MSGKLSPLWWPALAVASPVLGPLALVDMARFNRGQKKVADDNARRMEQTTPLELEPLEKFEITVLVEEKCEPGFKGDPGVSYLLETDRGKVLMDIGFGAETPTLEHNADKLGLAFDDVDALLVTHLHFDHMGGNRAMRTNKITLPPTLTKLRGRGPCYVPAPSESDDLDVEEAKVPQLIAGGLASTGPLARMFSLLGRIEEQAVVGLIKDKGLVVLTGCGHPTIEVILEMVRRMSSEPIYAVGGGLHFPVTDSRAHVAGIPIQKYAATGKPWWSPLNDDDLSRTIEALNASGAERFYISAHDSCDHSVDRFVKELDAKVEVLAAGGHYTL